MRPLLAFVLFLCVHAVQRGQLQQDEAPTLLVSLEGQSFETKAVLDANWRWIHEPNSYTNCYTNDWECSDCEACELEGVSRQQYLATYGIESQEALTLRFVTGSNIGSRVFLLKDTDYMRISPLNKRISFELDLSQVPCGVNAAVYLVNISSTMPDLGVGYGDAQCPTDIKYFGDGTVNSLRQPRCALEIDLTEANREAMAWTLHPCALNNDCDKAGADMNAYRQGFLDFYGPGKQVDTRYPFTVVTEIRSDQVQRFYIQNGQTWEHPGGILTSDSANQWSRAFGETSQFDMKGGFGAFWQEEYVFVISIWDDPITNMQWLDGSTGEGPGTARGPCSVSFPRTTSPNAFYTLRNLSIESL